MIHDGTIWCIQGFAKRSKTFKKPQRIDVIDKKGTLVDPIEGLKTKLIKDVSKIVKSIQSI